MSVWHRFDDPGAPLDLTDARYLHDEPAHLLRPIDLDLDLFLTTLPHNPRVNTMRIHTKIHSIHLLVSSAKYHGLMEFITAVTDASSALTAAPAPAPPAAPAPPSDGQRRMTALGSALNRLRRDRADSVDSIDSDDDSDE